MMKQGLQAGLLALVLAVAAPWAQAQAQAQARPVPVVVSTDVGDDIDDAFALALLLRSPELDVRGILASWGDTALRARLLQHLLAQDGRGDIPVVAGKPTHSEVGFSQARWAGRGQPPAAALSAAQMIVQQARARPGQVTLLVLGPLTDAAAALAADREGFAKLGRIVLMGGSIHEGYGKSDYRPATPPAAEYNIAADIPAAQAVFASGVPITMLPLDATKLPLEAPERVALFAHGDALTDALAQLYYQWRDSDQPWASATPTLFDVVPVAWLLAPTLCPTRDLHVEVDGQGFTRVGQGTPNVQACLSPDKPGLTRLYMQRLLGLAGAQERP